MDFQNMPNPFSMKFLYVEEHMLYHLKQTQPATGWQSDIKRLHADSNMFVIFSLSAH